MKLHYSAITSLIFLSFFVSNCYILAEQKDFIDATGRKIHLMHYPPHRIISLAPSITELIFALKKGSNLVGDTTYCNKPEQAKSITKVGGFSDPNLEIIASLKPDLVIATAQGNPVELITNLQKFSIPLYALNLRNVSEVLESIDRVSQLIGAEKEGKQLHAELSQVVQQAQTANAHRKKRPAIFFLLWYQPIVSAGKDSYINEIIELSGATSVTNKYTGEWLQLDREELYKLRFDAIVYAQHSPNDEEQFKTAIRNNFPSSASPKVYILTEEILRPSISFPEVIRALSAIVNDIPGK
jgi:cobalamin transport system substrate-binding protein